ncbi:endonuclease/exonuclease/phosphatase family protein [Pontibacter toksunensis]|uniref:Endonuclease/exonuclease/phosphatase family protein n=1 Tax=Pontibacter toksunensis TaxID=1332631 RepID=A0ABW6C020_9BACT
MSDTRKFFFYLLILLGTLLILATLGSLVADEQWWWVKVLDFPRIQVLIALVMVLVLFLLVQKDRDRHMDEDRYITRDREDKGGIWKASFIVGLVAAVVLQCIYLYPYTGMAEEQVGSVAEEAADPDATVSVLVVNVKMHNRESVGLLRMIDELNPDVVLAIEPNAWWEDVLEPVDEKYAYGMEHPLGNTYGMILYSKFPLRDPEILFLSTDSVPSFHTGLELPGGRTVKFHGVHPTTPFPSGPGTVEDREVALVKVGQMVTNTAVPAIVAGDFNDVSWAQRERLFDGAGLLHDTRVGRGIYPTFGAKNPIMRWPLDYVYVTEDFGVVALERLPDFGSDHFPFYAKLSLKP